MNFFSRYEEKDSISWLLSPPVSVLNERMLREKNNAADMLLSFKKI